jgi:hypothetical protein
MRRALIGGAVGLLAGFLTFAGIRMLLYQPTVTHYHANFALYIEGRRETFDDFTFYEETVACSVDDSGDPHQRVHMHERESEIVHVHDSLVTWGQFFDNIGFSVGDKHLKTRERVYAENNGQRVRFILNGAEVDEIAERVIGGRDRLLVDYGSDGSDILMERFAAVAHSAADYDARDDPMSCSGAPKTGLSDRLKHIFR